MRKSNKPMLLGLIAVFLVAQGLIHRTVLFPRWNRDYNPKTMGLSNSGLGPDQILFALAGFRELIAGILWVKADSFFETGNYDAVLPIIRLVTWLDPHQIDVYSTGMWHIAYNFTDEEHRSDRRYIPSAIALGKEGSMQNANSYELYFETGWIWYHKIDDDYHQAVKWFQDASTKADMMQGRRSVLSNAYQRNNEIQKALDLYYELFEQNKANAGNDLGGHGDKQLMQTMENNIDTMVVRMTQRGWLATERGENVATSDYDTNPPHDVGFSARVAVEEPAVIRVQGTYEVAAVGSRIRVVLRDENFPGNKLAEMDWDGAKEVDLDPQRDLTYMQDQCFVQNRRFNKRIDMSKDTTMYPAISENYIVELFYDPRSAPAHIQDRFGYNGEGFFDKNFIRTDVRPGHKVLYASMKISRDQLLRRGEWNMSGGKTPVVQTKNFKQSEALNPEDDKIIVPSILTEKLENSKKM